MSRVTYSLALATHPLADAIGHTATKASDTTPALGPMGAERPDPARVICRAPRHLARDSGGGHMAERTYRVWITVGEPDYGDVETCSTCGFDAVVTLPLTALSERGVSNWGDYKACGRCWAERHPE